MKSQRGNAEVLVLAGIAFVVFMALFGLDWIISSYQCGKRSQMMGLDSSWGPLQGCMVKVGSRYAPIGYVRIVDEKVVIQGDGE